MKYRLLLFCIALSCPTIVRAQLTGPPIQDNNYRLDLRQGPIIGSAKQVALGGAYIGIAEGITSLSSNPAGVAFRPTRSTEQFDWDWTAGVVNLASKDFDNNGFSPPTYASHRIVNLGLMGQYGPWGIGIKSDSELLKLEKFSDRNEEYLFNSTNIVVGRQFMDQQLSLGAGLRTTRVQLRNRPSDLVAGELSGLGWEAGLLWNPEKGPWRVGVAYASAINSKQSVAQGNSSPVTVDGLIVPSDATLPAQLGFGVSYQTKSAPFWAGKPWLLTADLVFIGKSENAVGIESVLAQVKQPVGTKATVSPRVGMEVEAWPGRARLRLGSYYEPAFYAEAQSRTHITGGTEIRIFKTHLWGEHDWSLTYTFDAARDYLSNFLSIGFWYF
ncbi:MAG: OmpP1/FadL family transporter [Burkholderiales bacterium]